MTTALADRVAAVYNGKKIAKAFPRFIVGLVLLMWVAPYMDVFYTKLDFNDRVSADVWYYESYHWLFLCLGPYLKNFFTVIGIYLCLVHKQGAIKTLVVSYSLMYDVGKIIWLLLVQNHDEYKMLTPKMFLTYGFITATFVVVMLDKLSFWLFHRVHAVLSRITGLAQIAELASPEEFKKAVIQTADHSEKVSQFTKY